MIMNLSKMKDIHRFIDYTSVSVRIEFSTNQFGFLKHCLPLNNSFATKMSRMFP